MELVLPILIGLFLAVNMGASGTAPAFAAPHGANLLRREFIPGLFGIFVLLGAALAGQKVVSTVSSEIVPAESMGAGLVAAILLAVALSLLLANLLRVPQSTSQATVLALVGSALYLGNMRTEKLLVWIIPAWFVLPLGAFAITYGFARFFYQPVQRTARINFNELAVHPAWRWITICSSCYVAFSIGANNVANAAGPLASLLANRFGLAAAGETFALVMLMTSVLVAPWFGIGSSLMGERVMRTTSKEIVSFGPLGASFISVLSASLLLLASVVKGIPTAEVQLNTAALIALGMVKGGFRQTFTKTAVPRVLVVWVVAPVVAFCLAYVLTAMANSLGLLS